MNYRHAITALFFLSISFGIAEAAEIIIDNSGIGYSDIGSWSTALNSCGYNGDYRFETGINDSETARWAPNITVNASYDVYVHYCVHSARPEAVPYKIFHAGGVSYSFVNQTENSSGSLAPDFTPSGFRYIGTFSFNTNNLWYIELNTSSLGDTSADAVMLSTGPYIKNKFVSSSCIFNSDDAEFYSNISSPECIDNVIFSVTFQNGTNINLTGNINTNPETIGFGNYTASLSGLPKSETVNWTVYAGDCFGNNVSNGIHSFYVNSRTILNITPPNPNGLNGWYTIEPLFSLMNQDSLSLFYKWDSLSDILYFSPFNMGNAPNNGSLTGGINILHYWSNVSCGIEKDNNITIKADFKNPVIKNLIPGNNSVVYNNQMPMIQAFLDEIFGSNSGINTGSITMLVDDSPVAITTQQSGIDALVRHNPISPLSLGIHNVTVNVSDNAGRNSQLTWFFRINTTTLFNLTVHYPVSSMLGERNIPFNITTTSQVSRIEYINYNGNNPRFAILCRNCDQYGFLRKQTQRLNEGENNITIRASDQFGQSREFNLSLFIDSREPRIIDILPRRNSVINGSEFLIKYSEDNLMGIKLFINPNYTLSGCQSGINKNCSISANISQFNGQFIDFYFSVSDINRTVLSKTTRVKVDSVSPLMSLNSPGNNQNYSARKIPVNISLSEKVSLEYYDFDESFPRFRRLCANCDSYGSENSKFIALSPGFHRLLFIASDMAGNTDSRQINVTAV